MARPGHAKTKAPYEYIRRLSILTFISVPTSLQDSSEGKTEEVPT